MKLYFEEVESGMPYMLRNDGELLPCGGIHPYIIYDPSSSLDESIKRLFESDYEYLIWFYQNTKQPSNKSNLKELCNEYYCSGQFKNISQSKREKVEQVVGECSYEESLKLDKDEIFDLLELCNHECNQEFCRVRTSALKFGIANNGIYFRISSAGFNWFDLIWNVVYKLQNRVSDVTVCTDTQSKGGKLEFYNHNGKVLKRMPIEEFINLSGNPIIESFNNYFEECLAKGMTIDESYNTHPRRENRMIESLWKEYVKKHFV